MTDNEIELREMAANDAKWLSERPQVEPQG